MKPTIILIELKSWGHHLHYINTLASSFHEQGWRVVCAYPEPSDIEAGLAYKGNEIGSNDIRIIHAPKHENQTKIAALAGKFGCFTGLVPWMAARIVIERYLRLYGGDIDCVYFCMADDYLSTGVSPFWLDLIFPYHWTGLMVHPTWLFNKDKRGIKQVRRVFDSKYSLPLYMLNEDMCEEAKRLTGKQFISFPDFADVRLRDECLCDDCIRIRGEKERGKRIVALLGIMDKRKGIFNLLDCARKTSHDDILYLLVGDSFSGESSKEVDYFQRMIREEGLSNVLFIRRRIRGEGEFNTLVNLSDLVFMLYDNFPYSSNIMTKAAYFNKPVIVSDKGLLGRRVREYATGIAVDDNDHISIFRQMMHLLDGLDGDAEPRFEEYARLHSQERLREVLRMELPAEKFLTGHCT